MKRLIAITGPSCGGKSTLREELIDRYPTRFKAVVTTTTRKRRAGEVNGTDYRFVRAERFEELHRGGHLLESVKVGSGRYGIEREALVQALEGREDGVAVVSAEGLGALAGWCGDNHIQLVRVLATAPISVLKERLRARRGSACEDEITERLGLLGAEISAISARTDYDVSAVTVSPGAIAEAIVALR